MGCCAERCTGTVALSLAAALTVAHLLHCCWLHRSDRSMDQPHSGSAVIECKRLEADNSELVSFVTMALSRMLPSQLQLFESRHLQLALKHLRKRDKPAPSTGTTVATVHHAHKKKDFNKMMRHDGR